jgi:signal transduction histidine kinase
VSIEFLRRLPLFAGLSEPDLERLYQQAQPMELAPNDLLIEEGAPGDALFVLIDGELQVTKRSGAQDVKVDIRTPGSVIGEMSLLDNTPRSASVRAITPSRLLTISKDVFEQVLSTSPSAALSTLHLFVARLRQNDALLHEKEKMAGLGTLAAGLAHELNNPAAAVKRAVAQLRDLLTKWQPAMSAMDRLQLAPYQMTCLAELRERMAARAAAPVTLDPLTRSDREGEIEAWLDDHGVAGAWELAPTLVGFGWELSDFENLAENFPSEHVAVIAESLGIGSAVHAVLEEVSMGSERISEIVKAVKSYSYLDRAPIQEVDVHDGLDNTLVILRHKLNKGSIQIIRDYDRTLPRIEAFAGELNQVWTNILDNAVDALGGHGEIRLHTYRDDDRVVVEIADNGPGIPPEIQSRVFEAFFTTKPPGVGTGLGLNIAYNVVNKHYGDIRLKSKPGETCFQVCLPIKLPRAQ